MSEGFRFAYGDAGGAAPRVRHGSDGVIYLSCGVPYEAGLPSLIDYLQRAAELRPGTTFLAERDASGGWRRLTYSAALRDSAAIAFSRDHTTQRLWKFVG